MSVSLAISIEGVKNNEIDDSPYFPPVFLIRIIHGSGIKAALKNDFDFEVFKKIANYENKMQDWDWDPSEFESIFKKLEKAIKKNITKLPYSYSIFYKSEDWQQTRESMLEYIFSISKHYTPAENAKARKQWNTWDGWSYADRKTINLNGVDLLIHGYSGGYSVNKADPSMAKMDLKLKLNKFYFGETFSDKLQKQVKVKFKLVKYSFYDEFKHYFKLIYKYCKKAKQLEKKLRVLIG